MNVLRLFLPVEKLFAMTCVITFYSYDNPFSCFLVFGFYNLIYRINKKRIKNRKKEILNANEEILVKYE